MRIKETTFVLSSQAAWAFLAIFVLLGAVLRAYHLNSGLWFDEIQTLLESVRSPLADILTRFPGNNDHLFYSVLAHLSIAVFGEHAWSLRLPSAVFGLATIPMLYIFALQVTSRLEAVAAASLLAISYHHIWFSQNARGYSMLLFWTLLTSYLLLKGLRDNRRATFIAYGAVAALGIYTHLTMAFVVAGHTAVAAWKALFARSGRPDLRVLINPALGFVLAGVFTLLMYAPILAEVQTFFEEKTVSTAQRVATPKWAFLATLQGLNIGFATAGGVILAGLLFLIGFLSYLRQSIAVGVLFVLPAPLILAAAVLLQRPVFPRFFFVLMGFGLLVAVRGAVVAGAWAAGRMRQGHEMRGLGRILPIALIAGMFAFSALALPELYRLPKQDFRGTLNYLEGKQTPNEPIVVVGRSAGVPFRDYFERPWTRIDGADEFHALRAEHGGFWLVFTFRRYIEHRRPALWNAIETHCAPAQVFPASLAGGDVEIRKCGTN